MRTYKCMSGGQVKDGLDVAGVDEKFVVLFHLLRNTCSPKVINWIEQHLYNITINKLFKWSKLKTAKPTLRQLCTRPPAFITDQTNILYRIRTRPRNMKVNNKTKFLNGTDFITRTFLLPYFPLLHFQRPHTNTAYTNIEVIATVNLILDGCVWQPVLNEYVMLLYKHGIMNF